MLSRFHRIPERGGQTDGQNCCIKWCQAQQTSHCAPLQGVAT